MIVAEFCDLIRKSKSVNERGSLPHNLGSYYNEFQIINYLGEDIFALDHLNQVVKIKPQEGAAVPKEDDRCIIIQYRFVQGPRQIGSMALEITPATHCKMIIPRSVLLREPVFVEEINALLFCPNWHPQTNLHPHSKEYIALQHDRLRAEIGRKADYSPITIMANDPTGKIRALHIELNGQICSVKVTNFSTDENEVDVVAIGIRGTTNGLVDDYKVIKTTFAELLRINPLCWTIGGFTISSDRIWLENKLDVDKSKPVPNTVPVEEIKTLLEKARAEDSASIENLTDILKERDGIIREWRARYTALRESFDDLIKGGYIDRNSVVAFKRINLEETKLHTAVEEAKLAQTTERLKLTKEQIATLATIAKTIAVIVPLIGLYLKLKQKGAS